MKDVIFRGSSLDDIRQFPTAARNQAGFEIDGIQRDREPSDWKSTKTIGPGVKELRIHQAGEHRVIYLTKFAEAVYVLHAFQKKSQKIAKRDLELARNRYKVLLNERMKR